MSDGPMQTAPGQSLPGAVPSLPPFEFIVAYCLARKQRGKPQTEVFVTNKRILIRQVGGDPVDEIPLRSVTTARPYRYLGIPLGTKRFVYVALRSKDPLDVPRDG